jgi:hypothetical protein
MINKDATTVGKTTLDKTTPNITTLGTLSVVMMNFNYAECLRGTTHFRLSLIIEGTTGKVSQFIMPLKSIYNKKICFKNKNVFLNIAKRLTQHINLSNNIINTFKICYVYLFSAAIYNIVFV